MIQETVASLRLVSHGKVLRSTTACKDPPASAAKWYLYSEDNQSDAKQTFTHPWTVLSQLRLLGGVRTRYRPGHET